jgi:hypothetical protein
MPGFFCIGKGTPDINSDGLADFVIQGTTPTVSENPALNTLIRPYLDTKVTASPTAVVYPFDGTKYYGVAVWGANDMTLDGQPHFWYIHYVVEGDDAKCNFGKLVSDAGWPNFSSSRPASGYTWDANGGKECYVALPAP